LDVIGGFLLLSKLNFGFFFSTEEIVSWLCSLFKLVVLDSLLLSGLIYLELIGELCNLLCSVFSVKKFGSGWLVLAAVLSFESILVMLCLRLL
jgi:hypothetical protein